MRNQVLIHGASSSRMIRQLSSGAPACVTVTILDGLVLARPAFESPNRKELKATAILALAIDEASVKTRSGPPDDDASLDAERDVWAGELPILATYGTPCPSPGLRPGIPVPGSVEHAIEKHRIAATVDGWRDPGRALDFGH